MFFQALTFAGSRGSCLNTRPIGRVFKLRPRARQVLMQWNKHVWSLFLHILPEFSIHRAENVALTLNIPFLTLDFSKQNGVSVNVRTSLRRHNVIYTRTTFSRTKASAKWPVTAATLSRVTSCIQIRAQFRPVQVKAMFSTRISWFEHGFCGFKQLRVTNSHARMTFGPSDWAN